MAFIQQLRKYYPNATIILLSSPMASEMLKQFMRKTTASVVKELNSKGERKVYSYIFSKRYNSGCDDHPSLKEHEQIATELTTFIRKTMRW